MSKTEGHSTDRTIHSHKTRSTQPPRFLSGRAGAIVGLATIMLLIVAHPVVAQLLSKTNALLSETNAPLNYLADDQTANVSNAAQQPEATEANLTKLIEQLDDVDFTIREESLSRLATLGERAIGPLAEKSFDCSAETQWRIKKTLEAICTNGAEDVFYKAISVIKVRFEEGVDSNTSLNNSLRLLEKKWRKKRKTDAVAKLRKLGAIVMDPLEGIDDQAGNFQVVGGNVMIINGGIIEIDSGITTPINPKTNRTSPAKKLSEKEVRSQIKSILESDIDENRERVFGGPKDSGSSALETALTTQIEMRNRLRGNQIFAGGFPAQASRGTGITIDFGKKWQGTNQDFELLGDLTNVESLAFAEQKIDSETVRGFHQLPTLARLMFDNCELEKNALKKGEWPRLTEIEFKNFEIDQALIQSCAPIATLQMLTFDACQMKNSALAKLKDLKKLRGLQFKETEIDKSIFKTLASLKQVTYVNLSVCKFQVADYKFLKTERPSLQIAYTAQAFFGVRGPINTGMVRPVFDPEGKPITQAGETDNCSISDVIPNSGAARAGIKIGDVIKSVNGQEIDRFEDLRLHIAQHQAGETIDVKVDRGGKALDLKVKLASPTTAPRF